VSAIQRDPYDPRKILKTAFVSSAMTVVAVCIPASVRHSRAFPGFKWSSLKSAMLAPLSFELSPAREMPVNNSCLTFFEPSRRLLEPVRKPTEACSEKADQSHQSVRGRGRGIISESMTCSPEICDCCLFAYLARPSASTIDGRLTLLGWHLQRGEYGHMICRYSHMIKMAEVYLT
jgi:hypothetical protein